MDDSSDSSLLTYFFLNTCSVEKLEMPVLEAKNLAKDGDFLSSHGVPSGKIDTDFY